ncbi:hypothetical protein JX265_011642 [Neoarthrinium moseri]|uniref:AB hydrolase-1 domain-containing protein n=1 Tax=Neoarthrinium moseri TaxID=1658444 RepID=A0A9P9WC51_9PEZI|nr:uncharacterized protein JN550_011907 [Neoarthrinium moseri]KAI1845533.1 hypothetical protein JX266_008391 [Neoarthrinium moseri]KAI1856395.1 hypothetical protein JX265_011642 [Neoarthrinium moseri]KAI1859599.1 hypothetical protein JN550_011907 [Neoarthrinium moseri]
MATTSIYKLADGRDLSYATYGSESSTAPVVFYFHGFPASHPEALMYDAAAKKHGIRLVAVDRPGMGSSTFQPKRRFLDWPADLLALADHLNVQRFALLGTSGGGPYVFACWREIPRSRCVGAGIVSSLYPTSLGTAGMLLEARVLLWVAPWLTGLVAMGLDKGLGVMARDKEHPEKFEQAVADNLKSRPPVDRALWENDVGNFRKSLVESLRGALQNGGQGAAWEARMLGSNWDFKLEELQVSPGQLIIWHGAHDINVPVPMAEKAAKLIPHAQLRLSQEDGHASLPTNKADEILESLAMMLSQK